MGAIVDTLGRVLIILVPLIGGLALIGVCALVILRNPQIENRNAVMLGVGALLCIAPTLATFAIDLPGVKIHADIKEQKVALQGQVGEQGASLKRDISDLKQSIDAVLKRVGAPPAAAPDPEAQKNRSLTVLVLFDDGRRETAQAMEAFLSRKGYTVNSIYTDFKELPEESRGEANSTRLVFVQQTEAAAKRVQAEMKAQFPDIKNAALKPTPKLSAGDLQIRLF
jgi:hypothetical protein